MISTNTKQGWFGRETKHTFPSDHNKLLSLRTNGLRALFRWSVGLVTSPKGDPLLAVISKTGSQKVDCSILSKLHLTVAITGSTRWVTSSEKITIHIDLQYFLQLQTSKDTDNLTVMGFMKEWTFTHSCLLSIHLFLFYKEYAMHVHSKGTSGSFVSRCFHDIWSLALKKTFLSSMY